MPPMSQNDPPRQMRVQSVRFSEETWEEIRREAHRQGVSASQFIRESAIARVAWSMSRREGAVVWDALVREIRRMTLGEHAHDDDDRGPADGQPPDAVS